MGLAQDAAVVREVQPGAERMARLAAHLRRTHGFPCAVGPPGAGVLQPDRGYVSLPEDGACSPRRAFAGRSHRHKEDLLCIAPTVCLPMDRAHARAATHGVWSTAERKLGFGI